MLPHSCKQSQSRDAGQDGPLTFIPSFLQGNRYPESPPTLPAPTHPFHHLLSLQIVEGTLVNGELQYFTINQAFFTQGITQS